MFIEPHHLERDPTTCFLVDKYEAAAYAAASTPLLALPLSEATAALDAIDDLVALVATRWKRSPDRRRAA